MVSMCKDSKNIASIQAETELFRISPRKKKVVCSFTAPDISSNGGLLLLSQVEQRYGFLGKLADLINEWRNPAFTVHSLPELVKQRVMQIAAGFEDADDCDRLRNDSALKMSVGNLPSDVELASQPTMSRLENHVKHQELYAIGELFIDNFLDSYETAPAQIVVDLDDTNANTYGAQQLTLFNNYYGEYCYMPALAFDAATGRLILPMLRPGRVNKRLNVSGLMRRLVIRIRKRWPKTKIVIRGDGQFCSHDFMDWVKKQRDVDFIFGLSTNSKLMEKVLGLMDHAALLYKQTGVKVKKYVRFLYRANSWDSLQWVIAKVEHSEKGSNVRFIVTSMFDTTAGDMYETRYCQRGICELFIKELKTYLKADRMSCSNFSANQFRLYLYGAAYVLLLQAKQELFKGTQLSDVSIMTFRERVILSAVRITEMKTQIKIEFQREHAMRPELEIALKRAAGWAAA